MSNIKQAKEIVSKELSLPASKLVGGTVANNSGTLEGTDLQLMYSEGYENGTAKNTSEVLAGTTTIAPTWEDGTNYVKKVKDGSWVAVENEPMFGIEPTLSSGKEWYTNGRWHTNVGESYVNTVDPFLDGSGLALYQLDGNTLDLGETYEANSSGTINYVSSKFGQGVSCQNDVTGKIVTPFTDSSTYSNIAFSFIAKGSGSLLGARVNNNINGIVVSIYPSDGFVKVNFLADGFGWTSSVVSTIPDSEIDGYYNCVIALTPTSIRVLINGHLAAEKTGTRKYNGGSWVLTGRTDVATSYFNGIIDQVRVLTREPANAQEYYILFNEEEKLFTELPPQTYLPYTVEATSGSVTAVNEWKYPDLVTEAFNTNDLNITNEIVATGLPTSDPLIEGILWNDAGTLKISAGA